jgi:polysaccharide export outer membrane protein
MASKRVVWLAVGIGLTLAACSHREYVWVDDLQRPPAAPAAHYRIEPGDRLALAVWNQDGIAGEYLVRNDGVLTVPLIGDVGVGGMSLAEATAAIEQRMDEIIGRTRATLSLVALRPRLVSVLGEVRQAGSYELARGEGVLELLARAGGLSEFADPDNVYVLRRTPAERRIRFDYLRLVRGEGRGHEFELRDGDTIVVE